MNIVRAILLALLSLNLSSELLHAVVKKNPMSLEAKREVSEKPVKGKELDESKAKTCQWWDNRC